MVCVKRGWSQGLEPGPGQRLGEALRKGSPDLHLEKYTADPSPSHLGSSQELAEVSNRELLPVSSDFSYWSGVTVFELPAVRFPWLSVSCPGYSYTQDCRRSGVELDSCKNRRG